MGYYMWLNDSHNFVVLSETFYRGKEMNQVCIDSLENISGAIWRMNLWQGEAESLEQLLKILVYWFLYVGFAQSHPC